MLQPSRSLLVAAFVFSASTACLAADRNATFKDTGPSGTCDVHDKTSVAWSTCVGVAKAGMPSVELFYAGYWLARTGRYEEALGFLTLADRSDERVLTYIGFATRKLGNVDAALPYYAAALDKNPNFSVARAYLGEAWLSKGEPAKARGELAEIGRRCGKSCAEYADLAGHIASFEAGTRG